MTDGAGNLTDAYSYSAFGELFSQTGDTTNSYRFTGQQYNSALGFYSMRVRYYDPGVGRFLTRDMAGINYSDPMELNRYAYVANNPVNATDPSGHFIEAVGRYQSTGRATPILQLGGLLTRSLTLRIVVGLVAAMMIGPLVGDLFSAAYEGITQPVSQAEQLAQQAEEALSRAEVVPLEQVDARVRTRTESMDIVYRNPNPAEHPLALVVGFLPRDPSRLESIEDHVRQGSRPGYASQFISLTRRLQVAVDRNVRTNNPAPIYAINLKEVQGDVYDLTIASELERYIQNPVTRNFARASHEVLVEGWIPPTAIKFLIPVPKTLPLF